MAAGGSQSIRVEDIDVVVVWKDIHQKKKHKRAFLSGFSTAFYYTYGGISTKMSMNMI
jgi:hypothetical protein